MPTGNEFFCNYSKYENRERKFGQTSSMGQNHAIINIIIITCKNNACFVCHTWMVPSSVAVATRVVLRVGDMREIGEEVCTAG